LGFSLFIIFVVAAFMPMVDIGIFGSGKISLYNLIQPTLLIGLASAGAFLFLTTRLKILHLKILKPIHVRKLKLIKVLL
jgi:hypothetical protein